MNGARRLGTNLLATYASRIGAKLLAFLFLIAVANRLGAGSYGRLVTAISVTSVLGILIDFGLCSLVTREVSRRRDLAVPHLRKASLLKAGFALLWACFTVLFVSLLGYPRETAFAIYILYGLVVFMNFADLPTAVYYAYDRLTYPSAFLFVSKAAAVGVGVFLLQRGGGVLEISGAMVLEGLGTLVLGYLFLGRVLRGAPRSAEKVEGAPLVRRAFPLAMASAMGILYFSIDTIMLSRMKGDDVVAWYNGAFRLMAALIFIPETFAGTVYPVLSRLHERAGPLRELLVPSFRFLLLLGMFVGALFAAASARIVGILYPEEFAPAAPVLRIMGITALFVFANIFFAVALNALNREKARLAITVGGVVLNVIVNVLLIPRYAHTGAAAATLLTQAAVFLAYLGVLRARFPSFPPTGFIIRSAAAFAGTILIARASAPLGGAADFAPVLLFPAACLASGAVDRKDLLLLRDFLRSWRGSANGAGDDQGDGGESTISS